MKTFLKILVVVAVFLLTPQQVEAQFLKKLAKKAEDKIEREAERRAQRRVDKKIDEKYDEIEDEIDGKNKGEKKEKKKKDKKSKKEKNSNTEDNKTDTKLITVWNKFDFIPGDKIIFEDNLIGEENGEFPSRWDLYSGTIENAVLGGENVIMFRSDKPSIIPYLKNSKADYLPDVFTVEFDLYLNEWGSTIRVYFYDEKNQSSPYTNPYLEIGGESMYLQSAKSNIPDGGSIKEKWAHIAIAYTKGKMKAYIDETRLINIPHLAFDPTGISLYGSWTSDKNPIYIKNFRIAEGGVKYYDRFLQNGKIIANGIRFDINKATLRPESMGVINKIVTLMKDNPDINFSVEGHTDSDGDDAFNLKLSENRAKTVMNTMTNMGIASNRLAFKGMGESKPIESNGTPEGKANNRRVEFVKM